MYYNIELILIEQFKGTTNILETKISSWSKGITTARDQSKLIAVRAIILSILLITSIFRFFFDSVTIFFKNHLLIETDFGSKFLNKLSLA